MKLGLQLFLIILSGVIGYVVGALKAFREAKQKAYQEILPPIIKLAYRSEQMDEGEYCEALCKLWLYGNKKVTKKMDKALYIIHTPAKGDMTNALKDVILEMRKDIQLFSCQKIQPDEVGHLFTRISKEQLGIDTGEILPKDSIEKVACPRFMYQLL